jgi:hypothetical protein
VGHKAGEIARYRSIGLANADTTGLAVDNPGADHGVVSIEHGESLVRLINDVIVIVGTGLGDEVVLFLDDHVGTFSAQKGLLYVFHEVSRTICVIGQEIWMVGKKLP